MKILFKDLKKGKVKLQVENLDDLWFLSHIIEENDLCKGRSFRKIKKGSAEKSVKKPIILEIAVTKVEFSKTSSILRVSGKITQELDDIPKGSHHTISIEPNTAFTLIKDNWLKYQIEKLDESAKESKSKILIVVFDREEAYFALMKKYGFEILSHIEGDVQKKAVDEKTSSNFYKQIIQQILDYDSRYKLNSIVVASPAFWKEELSKEIKDNDLKKKIIQATCSSVSKSGINEVLKRDEVKSALQQDRAAKEMNLVESLLQEISKQALAAYGLKETKSAVEAGAVKTLLITDSFIAKMREKNKYAEIDNIMKSVDKAKGDIHIISSDHDGGKKLDGLGGIAALLRYKLSY